MSDTRVARCRCGQLSATCRDEPVRVSVCHCRNCQRRTGGVFSAQARYPDEAVKFAGTFNIWQSDGEAGRRASYRWCPECGSTIAFTNEAREGVAILLGAFTDRDRPTPTFSIYEERKQPWVEIVGTGIAHHA